MSASIPRGAFLACFLSLFVPMFAPMFAFGPKVFAESPKPNVLFIAVDDLRPQLGCYGRERMQTPDIDRLAARGMLFERAYCMVPTCGASRASLMSGIRPARNRFVGYTARADRDAPGVGTLNTHFKRHGYTTVSLGKVFHVPADNADGWSEPPWRPRAPRFHLPENRRLQRTDSGGQGPPYEAVDVPDETYWDGLVARRAIEDLERLSRHDEPFFLAVGFYKPHLPFCAPRKYWDLYDLDEIRLPENYHRPQDAPDAAIHNWGELRSYAGVPKRGPLPDEMARKLIHGYYAATSYADAQVGKVLDALDRLELADDTVIVLWGDHGWNLGEHTLWCKHSCFEVSMRAPLIVAAPGFDGGRRTRGLTEFIDIYPSLSELAGLPLPEHLHGRSFVPLLRNPDMRWKETAIGRFGQGDTIRTDRYRFSEYTNNAGESVARMLYDHQADPREDVNISERPASRDDVRRLTGELRAQKGKDDDLDRSRSSLPQEP